MLTNDAILVDYSDLNSFIIERHYRMDVFVVSCKFSITSGQSDELFLGCAH